MPSIEDAASSRCAIVSNKYSAYPPNPPPQYFLAMEPLASQHGAGPGVDRDVLDGHADQVGAECVERLGLDPETLRSRLTLGTLGEDDTGGGGSHGVLSSPGPGAWATTAGCYRRRS